MDDLVHCRPGEYFLFDVKIEKGAEKGHLSRLHPRPRPDKARAGAENFSAGLVCEASDIPGEFFEFLPVKGPGHHGQGRGRREGPGPGEPGGKKLSPVFFKRLKRVPVGDEDNKTGFSFCLCIQKFLSVL